MGPQSDQIDVPLRDENPEPQGYSPAKKNVPGAMERMFAGSANTILNQPHVWL